MTLAELFNNNYEYLMLVAKRITRAKNHRLAPDLLSSVYLEVHDRQENGLSIPQGSEDFKKWFCKYMSNHFLFRESEFNKCQQLDIDKSERLSLREKRRYQKKKGIETADDNLLGELNSNPGGIDEIVDETAQRDIEICGEQANDFTRELIEISSSLGKTKTLKYIELIEFKRTLPKHEEILFDLYFEKELSTRRIAWLYSDNDNTMNYQSVNKMVNEIKAKIKIYKWKQLNS